MNGNKNNLTFSDDKFNTHSLASFSILFFWSKGNFIYSFIFILLLSEVMHTYFISSYTFVVCFYNPIHSNEFQESKTHFFLSFSLPLHILQPCEHEQRMGQAISSLLQEITLNRIVEKISLKFPEVS
ncbi:hypothetical protein ACOSQ2_004023 [Xanthoceras sorbifolium]